MNLKVGGKDCIRGIYIKGAVNPVRSNELSPWLSCVNPKHCLCSELSTKNLSIVRQVAPSKLCTRTLSRMFG